MCWLANKTRTYGIIMDLVYSTLLKAKELSVRLLFPKRSGRIKVYQEPLEHNRFSILIFSYLKNSLEVTSLDFLAIGHYLRAKELSVRGLFPKRGGRIKLYRERCGTRSLLDTDFLVPQKFTRCYI
jgi:hypothetical protein